MNNEVDVLADAEEPLPVTEDSLAQVNAAAKVLLELRSEVAELEASLADAKMRLENQETRVLPDTMDSAGFKKFTLITGEEIEIVPVIRANIPKEKEQEAFGWLINNGHEDLIKRDVTVNFGRGDYAEADSLVDALKADGYTPKDKQYVHWQTLTAFAKEQIEKGADMPHDLLGVWAGRKAKLKVK